LFGQNGFLMATETRKKEPGQYPVILTEQAWSIKDLLYGKRALSFCGTHRAILSGRDSAILPARVANHSAGFGFSYSLMELTKFLHFTVAKCSSPLVSMFFG